MASAFQKKLIFMTFLIMGLCAFQSWSRLLQDESMNEQHEKWMVQYGRTYKDNAEKERRFKIFKENVELIDSHNKAENKPYKLGINEFADLTNEEFRDSRNGYKRVSHSGTKSSFRYENITAVPTSMDWRQKGAVTAIKDQGQCGKPH